MSHLNETVTRVKNWLKDGKKRDPTKIDIFFTERCNLKCKFCNYSENKPENEMSDEEISKIIEEICEMDTKVFGILGGEPFLRKSILLKSMEKIKEKEINGSIVTNGTLIDKKDIERIIEMRWDLIRFSLDGLREKHDKLRGVRGTFDKVINNIASFHELKKKLNLNYPTIEINFVLTNSNYIDLEPLIKKISEYGINFVYILPLIELTDASKNLKISKDKVSDVNDILEKVAEVGKEMDVKINAKDIMKKNLYLYSNEMKRIIIDDRDYEKKIPPCLLPWYSININSDGSVTPCAQWPKSECIKLNGKSLKEIWYKDFEKMRNNIKNSLPDWCSRCCVPLVDENKEIKSILKRT